MLACCLLSFWLFLALVVALGVALRLAEMACVLLSLVYGLITLSDCLMASDGFCSRGKTFHFPRKLRVKA
jgi:hypothetical protein